MKHTDLSKQPRWTSPSDQQPIRSKGWIIFGFVISFLGLGFIVYFLVLTLGQPRADRNWGWVSVWPIIWTAGAMQTIREYRRWRKAQARSSSTPNIND